MTEPANHYVIVTIPGVKRMRGTVISLSSPTGRKTGVARLCIETHDVLDYGEYPAVYHTATQEAPGTFKVFKFAFMPNMRWQACGYFTRDRVRRWE